MQTNTNTHLTPKLRAPIKSFLDVRSQSQTSTDNLLSLSSAFSSLETIMFSQNKPPLHFFPIPILEAILTFSEFHSRLDLGILLSSLSSSSSCCPRCQGWAWSWRRDHSNHSGPWGSGYTPRSLECRASNKGYPKVRKDFTNFSPGWRHLLTLSHLRHY